MEWYWGEIENDETSIDRLLCKNWGSVAAGSFMNAFLGLPSAIIELLICHPGGHCGRCGYCCKNTFYGMFSLIGLIRTDSYSYINIFGIPYCDAGIECEKLCNQSQHFLGFQSAMRNFRLVACVVLLTSGILLSFLILEFRVSSPNIWFAIDLGILVLGVGSFFASIHPNIAEGIQTSFLVESYLASGYEYMQKCIPVHINLYSLFEKSYKLFQKKIKVKPIHPEESVLF